MIADVVPPLGWPLPGNADYTFRLIPKGIFFLRQPTSWWVIKVSGLSFWGLPRWLKVSALS
ncbi:MAG TPA: hypothetical protein V6D02_08955, partial [Candidatus Obscuribacterales bacterium]